MVQLHLGQPPGQQLGRGEDVPLFQHPHRDLPPFVGQLPGHGAQCHGRVGQVSGVLGGSPARVLLDGRLALPGAGVGWARLPGAHADQHTPHPVCVPGHVREDMSPGPPGEQRRHPQLRIGDNPRRVEQALRRLVDLVTQLT